MKHVILLPITFLLLTFSSCEDQPIDKRVPEAVKVTDFSACQLLFTRIEYDLYVGDRKRASNYTYTLQNRIKNNTEMFCVEEIKDLQTLTNDLQVFADQIIKKSEDWSLEKLRGLKTQFIQLIADKDYDPYLFRLWQFEEEMYYTSQAAIDPMLDLYEWNEFQLMVECMNETWESVNLHNPSFVLLDQNHESYRAQKSAKIQLQEAINKFNTAVKSEDYIKYDLCDYGVALRRSYIKYIKTFVNNQEDRASFLAKL